MVKVRLLAEWKKYLPGDVVEMNQSLAQNCLAVGVAERINKEDQDDNETENVFIVEENGKPTFKKINKNEAEKRQRKIKMFRSSPLPISNYSENAERFYEVNPYFFDRTGCFWFWDEEQKKYEIVDDIDVMRLFDGCLGYQGQTVNSRIKAHTLEAMKRYGREMQPKTPPAKWIQFKDKAYSIFSGKVYEVKPNYFFTNPIGWKIGETEETPIMDSLLEEWVGKDHVIDLYEIVAYCCYRNYPIQTMFCLYGGGRNGKSQFMKLLVKFLGIDNTCSTELDVLASPQSRFESFRLYKKLMCSMGETNFGTLHNTSMLKKLVGGDLIGFEVKNKTPFQDYNYSKILIGSNSLPSTEDTSDGFMRRWHILNFPNEFPEGKDIILTIPEEEYENLAKKVTRILPLLLERGSFTNQGSIEQRREKYIQASNPLMYFIRDYCVAGTDKHILYGRLYTEYVKYLQHNKKRKVKMKEFRSAIQDEGLYVDKADFNDGDGFKSGYYVMGVELKSLKNQKVSSITPETDGNIGNFVKELPTENNPNKSSDNSDNSDSILYHPPLREKVTQNSLQIVRIVRNSGGSIYENKSDTIIYLPCTICGLSPSVGTDTKGRPYCYGCWETQKMNEEVVK